MHLQKYPAFWVLSLLFCLLSNTVFAGSLNSGDVSQVLQGAKRIETSDGWFEVIKLPMEVYAFHEPGHIEQVTSFLILGETRDLLYDTGMGIASIKTAINEVRRTEGLPEKELMVLNSHGHLDHIGGNHEFDRIYFYDNEWRVRKLTEGIVPGQPMWVPYYAEVTGDPAPPTSFSPETMGVLPVPKDRLHRLDVNQDIDLGGRRLKVILSRSHTDDSLILFEPEQGLLFTGDVFVPAGFYVRDFDELYKDLKVLSGLNVSYHYNTHGPQMLEKHVRSRVQAAVKKITSGEESSKQEFYLGAMRKVYRVDGYTFWYLPEFLMY
ncbi:MBL fold metallo-hydrolase [Pseudomaricurvus alkylphenolicus]|uniref:MBL fold metallo-hydrolase n=1 Tax=Pseudomaricurvus alkylphenolicus TaxID=1306991 RepID=UPI0014243731|nr:MBL fold metallo-hydrolase [Pseudomaricurvus alkylphenolicus]NIB38019.1 MBL fold metallo-hydrolase [Pseudomaricurvus alkylphenolicus]